MVADLGYIQLECPLGNDLNPSCKMSSSVCVQTADVTKTHSWLKPRAASLTSNSGARLRSGLQREMRSGRGFPKTSFMPWVNMKAVARERARPIQPAVAKVSIHKHMTADRGGKRIGSEKRPTIQFPDLPLPYHGFRSGLVYGWTRDEEQTDEEDDAGWNDQRDDHKEPCWNGFVMFEGVRYREID